MVKERRVDVDTNGEPMRGAVPTLKGDLSCNLEQVRQGGEVVATKRGPAPARMLPIDAPRRDVGLDALEAEGLASPAGTSDRNLPGGLLVAAAPASPLVAEQRT